MSILLRYPTAIEEGITRIESLLTQDYERTVKGSKHKISRRSLALLLIQGDPIFWQQVQKKETHLSEIKTVINYLQSQFSDPLVLVIAKSRHQLARKIAEVSMVNIRKKSQENEEFFHQVTVNPITGFPLAFIILYVGFYEFVGRFGAGTLVNYLEGFFTEKINPWVNEVTEYIIPSSIWQDLIAHDYGIITLGLRYAISIVFPIVLTFFLMFSLLEDSGYLPRLSILADRLFKALGLSGRSLIPLTLGLGCGSMATLVTRTLESKRERIITTLLLALVIPCSAQLGIIIGLLSQNSVALIIWGCMTAIILLFVGSLTAKILPGNPACFYMEIPPLRLPSFQSVILKTYSRIRWYLKEIIPLFILASGLIWFGKLTGIFDLLMGILEPIMINLGLSQETATIFLYGLFRRDYGAAGLFDLYQRNLLVGRQLVVATVTLTLFIPCFSQIKFMLKEQGLKTTVAMTIFIFVFAFLIGYLLNKSLIILGVIL
ncbi:MAG TPA: ferrous iron transporter B [Cyanothece sp. UBA12306]|nr:ferrous iron transporter B [Cyanothece sp. UBA12306]